MKKLLSALFLGLSLSSAHAAEPTKHETPKEETKQADRTVLTSESLLQTLTDLGYDIKDVSAKKNNEVIQVTIDRNGWKIFTMVSLSTDRTVVWLEAKFKPIDDLDAAPAESWQKLLKLNNEHNPYFFGLENGRLHVWHTRDNLNITPAQLRQEIDNFDFSVRKMEPAWASASFKAAPKMEPLTDAGRATLEKLAGTWSVVAETRNGVKTTETEMENAAMTYTFVGDRCRIKAKTIAGLDIALWTSGDDALTPLDTQVVGSRTIQKSIMKLDGDTLTLCIATANKDRPTSFEMPSDFDGQVLVLKKQK